MIIDYTMWVPQPYQEKLIKLCVCVCVYSRGFCLVGKYNKKTEVMDSNNDTPVQFLTLFTFVSEIHRQMKEQ